MRRRRQQQPPPTEETPAETTYLRPWRSFAWRGRVFVAHELVRSDDPLVVEICQSGAASAFYVEPRES